MKVGEKREETYMAIQVFMGWMNCGGLDVSDTSVCQS